MIFSSIALRFSGRPSKVLLDRLHLRVDVGSMLSQSPGNTHHVRSLPREDVPVLTEELDQLAFLFAVKGGGDIGQRSIWIFRVNAHRLGLSGRLESGFHNRPLQLQ